MCQFEACNINTVVPMHAACAVVFVQLLLGPDGADMAVEVLPARLLSRVDAAWAGWCKQHGTHEPLVSDTASVV